MNVVDLHTLVEIYSTDKKLFERFSEVHNIDIRLHEMEGITILLSMFSVEERLILFNDYLVGYKIKQIGKEFDLLRVGDDSIVNIELKSQLNIDDIKEQCQKNYYYLSSISRPLEIITFVSSNHQFYKFNPVDDSISELAFLEFKKLITKEDKTSKNLDELFEPKNYLVSPFNSPQSFLKNEYFLTKHQKDILLFVMQSGKKVFSIEGGPGTGKTLLLYTIAKEFIKADYDVTIIHCGYLNAGQYSLKKEGYNIVSVKEAEYWLNNVSSYSIILVDESQRLKSSQLEYIFQKQVNSNCFLVLSHDQKQVLSNWEEKEAISTLIKEKIAKKEHFKLNDKIRTNPELADFIQYLLKVWEKPKHYAKDQKIEYSFVSNYEKAKQLATLLKRKGWEIINPTPSSYNREIHDDYIIGGELNAHKVIGQEFENVVLIIPESYYYNENGELKFGSRSYYGAEKMFYQAITRTRDKLHLIIVNNLDILERVLDYEKQRRGIE